MTEQQIQYPEGVTVPARVQRAVNALAYHRARELNADRTAAIETSSPLWTVIKVEVSSGTRTDFTDWDPETRTFAELGIEYWTVTAERGDGLLYDWMIASWTVPSKGRSRFNGGTRSGWRHLRSIRSESSFYNWASI